MFSQTKEKYVRTSSKKNPYVHSVIIQPKIESTHFVPKYLSLVLSKKQL
jgi:hypothetical protein